MDLHKIAVFENEVVHGAPKHTTMLMDLTLQEIIRDGKVTNSYQLYVLCYLSEFFKNGFKSVDLDAQLPVKYGVNATSVDVKMQMLSFSNEEHVALATYLLACIQAGESSLYDPKISQIDWMKFVLSKQD